MRRLKQRAENLPRALLMRQLRLEIQNAPQLLFEDKKLSQESPSKFFIGCSGWYYLAWKNLFYPQELSGSKWFEYYSSHFATVELNAPFYSWPLITTVKTWLHQVRNNPDFIYTIKVNELITHVKHFCRTKTLVKDFYFIADLLGEKMGCLLFQLPPSFKYSKTGAYC